MDDDEHDIQRTVRVGQRNKATMQLVRNWCRHAEIDRSPGRGLIEEFYHVPIGHMGIRCKHVDGGSLHSWLLEDAAYDFYLEHCKTCKKREPVGIPNITTFVAPREEAAAQGETERKAAKAKRHAERLQRAWERDLLRVDSEIATLHLIDLIDELDTDGALAADTRLEEMARLAPEAFGPEMREYLFREAMGSYAPYADAAARALLVYGVERSEMLTLATRLLSQYSSNELALSRVLAGVHDLSEEQVGALLPVFVSLASPPRPSAFGNRDREINNAPLEAVFVAHPKLVSQYIDRNLDSTKVHQAEEAARTLIALNNEDLFSTRSRAILSRLMRRRSLFPDANSRSDFAYYFREAAVKAFRHAPEYVDAVIQSFLLDQSEAGRHEASLVYERSMRHGYEKKVARQPYHSIAFGRLLWAAVAHPSTAHENNATNFFRHTDAEYAWLAAEQMDALIGAAATLSEKLQAIDKPGLIQRAASGMEQIEKSNQRAEINLLQGTLVAWAALGASARGKQGVTDFLGLYDNLPASQLQMRANVVAHFADLMSEIDSMQLVLSHVYRALLDEEVRIRASAANVLDKTNYRIAQHFPDLLFEAYVSLLSDPFTMVHKAAVWHIRPGLFPDWLKPKVRSAVINLILVYAKERHEGSFVVECIGLFVRSFCDKEERAGSTGAALTEILETLDDNGIYEAVDKLYHSLRESPGFIRVVLKALSSEYTRSISTEDCLQAVLLAPREELATHWSLIRSTFEKLMPFSPAETVEAYVLVTSLTRAARWNDARDCTQALLDNIPDDERHKALRLNFQLLLLAASFEAGRAAMEDPAKALDEWTQLTSELEETVGRQTERNRIPRSFFE